LLNWLVGTPMEIDGMACIATTPGADGHAVYGDYLDYPGGDYAVGFRIGAVENQNFDLDFHCAEIDVALGNDTIILARQDILLSDLKAHPPGSLNDFSLTFRLEAPGRLQFRIAVNGRVPLLVQDHRPLALLPHGASASAIGAALMANRFPNPDAPNAPAFLVQQRVQLRRLFDQGIRVRVLDGEVVLESDGVCFLARVPDDLAFVGEIFLEKAYNVGLGHDTCVIDIGMNSGLVTLLLASHPAVREVHGFEPFVETFRRACANIALNPTLAPNIHCYNIALADHDEDGTFIVPDMGSSGSMTIRQIGHGIPVALKIRDAATMLGPIIEAAVARGRTVVLKVDCEGSEFAIFASLEKAGLLDRISAFMVEWHRVFDGCNQETLLDALHRHGFITFDRSPKTGNGFFYAVRSAA